MKTLKAWEESNKDFDEYCPFPSEIDEDLHEHFMGILPPNYDSGFDEPVTIYQLGEAETSFNDVFYYNTFKQIGKKFFYLGMLPDMNLIEKEAELVDRFCEICPMH